jgi:hypothetical protein
MAEDVEHLLALRRLEAGIPEQLPDGHDDSQYGGAGGALSP